MKCLLSRWMPNSGSQNPLIIASNNVVTPPRATQETDPQRQSLTYIMSHTPATHTPLNSSDALLSDAGLVPPVKSHLRMAAKVCTTRMQNVFVFSSTKSSSHPLKIRQTAHSWWTVWAKRLKLSVYGDFYFLVNWKHSGFPYAHPELADERISYPQITRKTQTKSGEERKTTKRKRGCFVMLGHRPTADEALVLLILPDSVHKRQCR